jgi:hypothetical protein
MMIFTVAVVLGTLLSSTQAKPLGPLRANPGKGTPGMSSLGDTFLAIAKNYTLSDRVSMTATKSGSYSLELDASAIKPLAAKFDLLCDQQGSVSSKSQSGNDTVTTSYSLGCSLTKEKYGVYEAAVIVLLKEAQGNSTSTTSYSFYSDLSSYGYDSYSTDPNMYLALQKALETLMAEADTIEEVMLVFSSWQSYVGSYGFNSGSPTSTSTISVSLSEKYQYVDQFPIAFLNETFLNETIDD